MPPFSFSRRLALRSGVGAIAAGISGALFAQNRVQRYEVYDRRDYSSTQLPVAASSPVAIRPPQQMKNGGFWIPRANDGHFYIQGSVNGFPVVFLVDTGASQIVVPLHVAVNAGIRAGLEIQTETAAGKSSAGETRGNKIEVGPYSFTDATIIVAKNLQTPLLGMSVLSRFSTTSDNTAMVLSLR